MQKTNSSSNFGLFFPLLFWENVKIKQAEVSLFERITTIDRLYCPVQQAGSDFFCFQIKKLATLSIYCHFEATVMHYKQLICAFVPLFLVTFYQGSTICFYFRLDTENQFQVCFSALQRRTMSSSATISDMLKHTLKHRGQSDSSNRSTNADGSFKGIIQHESSRSREKTSLLMADEKVGQQQTRLTTTAVI